MKVSKESHRKTAVSLGKNAVKQEPMGILYEDITQKDNPVIDIKKELDEKIKNIRSLYAVFSVPDKIEKASDESKLLISILNRAVKNHINPKFGIPKIQNHKAEDIAAKIIKAAKDDINDSSKNPKKLAIKEEHIAEAMAKHLRSSLSRPATFNAIKSMLIACAVFKEEWGDIDERTRNNICSNFINIIMDDINKITGKHNYKEEISWSIENQNMVIQPSKCNESILLTISKPKVSEKSSETAKRKANRKQAFMKFLEEYADLDDSVRQDLRKRLRCLTDLYFYGEETVIDSLSGYEADNYNEWEIHRIRREIMDPFLEVKFIDSRINGSDIPEIKENLRNWNVDCYAKAIKAVKNEAENNPGRFYMKELDLNLFWIEHMENAVERIYKIKLRPGKALKEENSYIFSIGWLSEKVWKDLLNYISIKYIAIGKSVYHFAMNDLEPGRPAKMMELGKIEKNLENGYSSFEYEFIKAEETIQRESAVYSSFAINNISNVTIGYKRNVDLFTPNLEGLQNIISKDECIRKNILQFFGGITKWNEFKFEDYIMPESINNDIIDVDILLLDNFRKILYAVRNESFHFKTFAINEGNWNTDLISAMFEYESQSCINAVKSKYFSNNLHMFYSVNDLKNIIGKLYRKTDSNTFQVPAYRKVFVRANFPDYIRNKLKIDIPRNFDDDTTVKWQNAIYFLLKEIYYKLFLEDIQNVSVQFDESLVNMKILLKLRETIQHKNNIKIEFIENDDKRKMALNNFYSYIEKVNHNCSLPEFCQLIMAEQAMQNQGSRKKKSKYVSDKSPDLYRHFREILFNIIRAAFAKYLERKEFSFIKNPLLYSYADTPENFLPDYQKNLYIDLCNKINKQPRLQEWYIVGRLITPRQLNHLIGAFKSYIQYIENVRRRAGVTGNILHQDISVKKNKTSNANKGKKYNEVNIIDSKISYAKEILKVLDFCALLSGIMSNNIEDYFKDKDEYARYVNMYVDFGYNGRDHIGDQLAAFCGEIIKKSNGQKIGIYYDGNNPIPNRNIVMSKLFAPVNIISEILKEDRVSMEDISEYYNKVEGIMGYKKSGICKTKEHQVALREFQELKNRVELLDVINYAEIISDLQAQMINWAFLRERDLMYFQLGFHYIYLNNYKLRNPGLFANKDNDNKSHDGYFLLNTGSGKHNNNLKNAILYQICAMYIGGLGVYSYDENKKIIKNDGNDLTSKKIGQFINYTENTIGDRNIYDAGLELFENVKEHDNITDLRNYIDHFHYYTDRDRSILDLYSEIFDRFFTYDMKYRKNVPNMLRNILLRHFVIFSPEFSSGEKAVGKKKKKKSGDSFNMKPCASIYAKQEYGIDSDDFVFKLIGEGESAVLPAKGERFLRNVSRILYYPCQVPDNVVRCIKQDVASTTSAGYKTENYAKDQIKGNKENQMIKKGETDDKGRKNYKQYKTTARMGALFDFSKLSINNKALRKNGK